MSGADTPRSDSLAACPSSRRRAATPARPRPPGTFKVGTIAGSDVLVTSSWFLIAALIAWTVSPRVDQVSPGLGGLKYVAGFAFAVVLYLSVLLHEASHAYMARHYGFADHLDHPALPRRRHRDRGRGPDAAPGVLDRRGRAR